MTVTKQMESIPALCRCVIDQCEFQVDSDAVRISWCASLRPLKYLLFQAMMRALQHPVP